MPALFCYFLFRCPVGHRSLHSFGEPWQNLRNWTIASALDSKTDSHEDCSSVLSGKCVRQSRIFIARILILLRKVHFNHHHVNLTAEFRKDIAWWRRFLRAYNGVSMISTAQWSSPGAMFPTDACLMGCGGLCGDQYFHAVFPSYVVQQTLDINCLELLTIIVALKLWGSRLCGLRLSVRCDNEVAVTVLTAGRCRNSFLNSCLRELCYLAAIHEFEVRAVHVPGVLNCYADLLSRRDSCDIVERNQFLAHAQHANLHAVPVHDDLFQFDSDFWSSFLSFSAFQNFGGFVGTSNIFSDPNTVVGRTATYELNLRLSFRFVFILNWCQSRLT